MHQTVQNLIQIKEEIKEEIIKNNIVDYEPNIIAVFINLICRSKKDLRQILLIFQLELTLKFFYV